MLSWSSTTSLPTLPCAWGPITPSLRVVHVGIARTCMVAAGVERTSAGGVCTCAVAWGVSATPWSSVRPAPVLSRVPSLSSTILRTGQTALQGSLRWTSGRGVACARHHHHSNPASQMPQEPQWWATGCLLENGNGFCACSKCSESNGAIQHKPEDQVTPGILSRRQIPTSQVHF